MTQIQPDNTNLEDLLGQVPEALLEFASLDDIETAEENAPLLEDVWEAGTLNSDQQEDESEVPVTDKDIEQLLSAFTPSQSTSSQSLETSTSPPVSDSSSFARPLQNSDSEARQKLAADPEMLEAYLDDALRSLNTMEQAALAIEINRSDRETIQQYCRELHTLKGASATVGLACLASELHDLETDLQDALEHQPEREVDAEPLLAAIDRIRADISSLQTQPFAQSPTGPSPESRAIESTATPAQFAGNDHASVRIRANQLDRLMDMLAELVVLRNRRESHVSEHEQLNDELIQCATRLNQAEANSLDRSLATETNVSDGFRLSTSTYTEIAKDITAVSNELRKLQKPAIHDNAAISRFIRDFRQELMQLRRIPVSGLFKRLQRAARDAAKSEQKQVRIEVVGDNTGLEQEIQERLYESLLHIVRNSVSHGIESPDQRSRAGKDQMGTVTLEASTHAQLLVIEVRDDGRGLDYESVHKRGIERGLLTPQSTPTKSELAKLIFHPGFSTRDQASEVSGRGIGMDIVSKTLESIRGRIEIESTTGQGTTMRLLIPLRTGIEHAMVFRSGSQLFALPMQSITAVKSTFSEAVPVTTIALSKALGLHTDGSENSNDLLLLRQARKSNRKSWRQENAPQFALSVDELVGPEEVVILKLPSLLQHHPLFCGVALSGSGERVLLLDSEQIVDFCRDHASPQSATNESDSSTRKSDQPAHARKQVLVVDDSLTARRALAKLLQQYDFATVEASDGIEAIEQLHRQSFDLVFTDLDMPRLGGLELLSDVQSSQYCDAPIVVVSSREAAAFRVKSMEAGAFEFLSKPIREPDLRQILQQLDLLTESR